MSPKPFFWHRRPGLAGGIDKEGSRAGELLGLGFGSVEFGTVAPQGEPGSSLAALVSRLAGLPPRLPGATAIGIGLGLPPDTPAVALPVIWQAGLEEAWPVADYLSFNLSARAYRPLHDPAYRPLLATALAGVAAARDRLSRRVALAVKLPLGSGAEPLPELAEIAAIAGFDMVTAVMADGDGLRYTRLATLARRLQGGPALVAVGGIRSAADMEAAHAVGADGVQVHRLFAEKGADCLPCLLGALTA